MNVVVIGLGSMGRRRIRLIKQYNDTFTIIGIDHNSERRYISNSEYGIETSSDLNKVMSSFHADCAFICTSPLSHNQLIHQCLQHNLHVFTELNLVADGYAENINLSNEHQRVLFLSSTFLYRAEIKQINKLVKLQEGRLNYSYHVGQYLPDWHPWENYKDFFVGDKRTNGCREIFAIELPWLIEVFGEIKNFDVRKSKNSTLSIDYNDNYILCIEHVSGHKGLLAVDVLSRTAVRNLEVFGEDLYVSWDGSAEGLKLFDIENRQEQKILLYEKVDQLKQYSKFVVENAYYDEIASFFDAIYNNSKPVYDFEKDLVVLSLVDEIEA